MQPRMRRHENKAGGWEFAEPVGYRGWGAEVCGYREWGGPVRRREVPHDGYTLILSFGDPLMIDGERYTSMVAGLHDRPVVTAHQGAQHGIEVRLPPATARALLRRPLYELTNSVVALPDLLADADRLVDQLAGTPDWATRFDLLHCAFAARLVDAEPLAGEVRWALDALTRTHGRAPVSRLVTATGWSQRHFTTRFREQVGMAPKALARVLRFQQAYQSMRAHPQHSWAQIAADAGYYDQPHLNREFRELAGLPPGALLAAALPEYAGIAA